MLGSALDAFGVKQGLLVPGMKGWEGCKTHAAHSAGGTPESSPLGEPAKGSRPARPGTGRGHERSALAGGWPGQLLCESPSTAVNTAWLLPEAASSLLSPKPPGFRQPTDSPLTESSSPAPSP